MFLVAAFGRAPRPTCNKSGTQSYYGPAGPNTVQALLLYWGSAENGWEFVGAAPVSTGSPVRYERFTTPLGVFDHTMSNPEFRAEGTKNKLGFRGYGRKGLRIYDFGWVEAPRGWGNGAMGKMRLQMHSTDAELAAPKLVRRNQKAAFAYRPPWTSSSTATVCSTQATPKHWPAVPISGCCAVIGHPPRRLAAT